MYDAYGNKTELGKSVDKINALERKTEKQKHMTNIEKLRTLDAEELAWKLFFRLGLNEAQRNHFERWLEQEESK